MKFDIKVFEELAKAYGVSYENSNEPHIFKEGENMGIKFKPEYIITYLHDSYNKHFDIDFNPVEEYRYEFLEFIQDLEFCVECNYGIDEYSVLLKDKMVRSLGFAEDDLNVYRDIIRNVYRMIKEEYNYE